MPKAPLAVLSPGPIARIEDFPVRVSWSPDGTLFAVAGGEGGVYLASLAANGLSIKRLGSHGMGALDVAWRPGSREFASCGQDNLMALWSADTTTPLWRTPRGKQWVDRLAWRADGLVLASAVGRQVALRDPTGAVVHEFEPLAGSVNSLAWSRDSRDIAAAQHGGVMLLRADNGRYGARFLELAENCLTAEFSRNGKVIVTGTAEGSVHFWYLLDYRDSQMRGYGNKVEYTVFTGDSRYLATAAGNELVVWDFGGKGPEGTKPQQLRGHTERISAIAAQPNGNYVVTAGLDWRLSLWLPGKTLLALDAHLADAEPALLSWSPDGRKLVMGEQNGQLAVYELAAPR